MHDFNKKNGLCILGCTICKTAYNLRQFLPPKLKNSDFKHRDYLSVYIAVHLAVYVFDCNVTGVPCEGVWMWSLLKICISLCQWTKNTRKYVYETENNDLRLDFQNAFHIVFLTSVLEAFKVFEFAWHVLENKPLPSHCPRKNMLYLSWALSAWATRQ